MSIFLKAKAIPYLLSAMPTSNVVNRDFESIFKSEVRFEIPFFQRGYSWKQEQWKKLFEDIQGNIIENIEDSNLEDEEYFFGPVVVLEKIGDHAELKKFTIIDGQQRITTVYVLLSVIKRLMKSKSHLSGEAEKYIEKIDKLLFNNINAHDDYLKLKVFSTKGDRLPTYKAIFESNPHSPYLAEDQQLYDPQTNGIDALHRYASKYLKQYDIPRLWTLYLALTKSLRIVWIPLDEAKDDVQAIFESLNNGGLPLSASELLCNYIFKPIANKENNDHERIHNDRWLTARHIVGESEFEEYLRNLFSIGEKKRVGKERRMYVHFKSKNRKLNKSSALSELDKIFSYTSVYNQIYRPIEKPHSNHTIKNLLVKINDTNMISIYPYLMSILKSVETDNLSEADAILLLKETYTLLVRRKLSNLPVTRYDSFFPNLFDRIVNEPEKIRALQKCIQHDQLWVSDQVFADSLVKKELYNGRELNFCRLVLQELDRSMQLLGELPDYSTINTIEHVLPQTLNANWSKYLGTDAGNPSLNTVIHTLGNLSLNSSSANSTFGQKSFQEKQSLYPETSALARDIRSRVEPWNISAIEQRSSFLADFALKVWAWTI